LRHGDFLHPRPLIDLQGNDGRANQDGRDGRGIRRKRRHVQAEHEILGALEANAPERLSQQFVTLPAMEFVQEIIEVTRRGLLVPFQAQQFADIVFVKLVHAALA
jgi:hypothetical protein